MKADHKDLGPRVQTAPATGCDETNMVAQRGRPDPPGARPLVGLRHWIGRGRLESAGSERKRRRGSSSPDRGHCGHHQRGGEAGETEYDESSGRDREAEVSLDR